MSEPFLEALFHELRCTMLQFAGLPVFWSVLLLGDAGMYLFWQGLWCLVEGMWAIRKF